MSTPSQIRANQQNALLSCGPRSVEGKAASRRNALKSGIHAVAETALPSENPEELEALKSEYYDRWVPTAPEERCLVDILIRDEWLLRRFAAIQGQIHSGHWEGRYKKDHPEFATAESYCGASQTLGRLQRRITATEKSYKDTFALLKKIRPEAPQVESLPRIPNPPDAAPDPDAKTEPLPVASDTPSLPVAAELPPSSARNSLAAETAESKPVAAIGFVPQPPVAGTPDPPELARP